MPQNGLHGLAGLAVARFIAPRVPPGSAAVAAAAVTLGAMLPDADAYPAAVGYLLGYPHAIEALHRTFTHSAAAILGVALLGEALARGGTDRRRRAAWWCRGIALGMGTHVFLDLFFWFAALDLFWPLSHLPPEGGVPLLPVLNLWEGVRLPTVLRSLREACEFAGFALYLGALRRIAAAAAGSSAPPGLLSRMALVERIAWGALLVALAGAFLLPYRWQLILVMAPYLLLFLPFCWSATLRLGEELGTWATGGGQAGVKGRGR